MSRLCLTLLLSSFFLIVSGSIFYKNEMWEECLEENSMSPTDLETFKKMPTSEAPEEYFCVIKCVHTKAKVLAENGEINVRRLESVLLIEEIKEVREGEKCKEEVGKVETCEDARKLRECIEEHE